MKAKFLSPGEKHIAQALASSQPGEEAPGEGGLQLSYLIDAFKDYRSEFGARDSTSLIVLPDLRPSVLVPLLTYRRLALRYQ